MTDTKISILLPTRGRTKALEKSIVSLLKKATNPERLEILFGFDNDDPETIEFVKNELSKKIKEFKTEARASIFNPLGSSRLHDYLNELVHASVGDWIFLWNDDAVMVTEGWDDMICEYNGEFKLLAPTDNHDGHPYAIFPIVPRDWFILIGNLSHHTQYDAWLSHIAYMLDIFQRTDIEVIHDRADLTGNNDDETYQSRYIPEKNPDDPADFDHSQMQSARWGTAAKIAWFLKKCGNDTIWWDNVMTAKQNPFEKMVWHAGAKGTDSSPSRPDGLDEREELSDDEILSL